MTNFHTRLKQLRKTNELTQEQLAEYMGVSPQAISRWETGATYPDVSQIPLLAHIFHVSADTLLGIDTTRINEAIAAVREKANECTSKGDFHGAVDILRAGLAKYPRAYSLMVELAENLSSIGKDGSTEEIVSLCETVIAECTENEWCDKALQTLVFRLKNVGEREKAMTYVNPLSSVSYSKEDMTIAVYETDTPTSTLKEYVSFCADRLMMCLAMLSHKTEYTINDKITLLHSVVDICNAVYPDSDANYYAHHAVSALSELAKVYAALQDEENTLKVLEGLSRYAVLFDNYSDDDQCTSPAVRGVEHGRPIPTIEMMREQVRKILSDSVYDFVREDTRFAKIENCLLASDT